MPRDLFEQQSNAETEDSASSSGPMQASDLSTSPSPPDASKTPVRPYVQSLTKLDLDSCIKLEEATFPPQEACTREKLLYRFTKCGELSVGLFTSADTEAATGSASQPSASLAANAITASTAHPVHSGAPNRKSVLLAHVIATKTDHQTVTDADMDFPKDWSEHNTLSQPGIGHQEHGRNVCVHSLAVLPSFQRRGLGKLLLKSYIQRIESSGLADRISLISHQEKIPLYEDIGFVNLGPSKVQYGGGGWYDMVLDLKNPNSSP